jgi:hypothetical protein
MLPQQLALFQGPSVRSFDGKKGREHKSQLRAQRKVGLHDVAVILNSESLRRRRQPKGFRQAETESGTVHAWPALALKFPVILGAVESAQPLPSVDRGICRARTADAPQLCDERAHDETG